MLRQNTKTKILIDKNDKNNFVNLTDLELGRGSFGKVNIGYTNEN
jgi:hypothetical protein